MNIREFQPAGQTLLSYLLEELGMSEEEFHQSPYDFDSYHDPFLMKDMGRAVERTLKAIERGEPINVSGDYDADGISSTVVMVQGLKEAGAKDVEYRIPDRREGYGLNNNMIDEAHEQGVKLIITVDNGIACNEQVEYAKTLGIDVIITDHHEPQETLPDTIVINPKRKDCGYPFKELAGCGVAWKFVQALNGKARGRDPKDLLTELMEFVTIGTIADVMEMKGENRSIVKVGLEQLKNPKNSGIRMLMQEMDLFKYEMGTDTVGFSIGPALNAAGRLGDPSDGVELFLNKSPIWRQRRAEYLKRLNEERKEWSKYYTDKILSSLNDDDKVIVHYEPGVPEGIVGIIASRIVEKKGKPTLLMTEDSSGTFLKGSGRSVEGYDLFQNVMENKPLFKAAGGHEMACGFSIEAKHLNELKHRLNASCKLESSRLTPGLEAEFSIEPHLISMELAEAIASLEPTGTGFEKPTFLLENCEVISHSFIGKDKQTLRLDIGVAGYHFSCIGFKMADSFSEILKDIQENKDIDIVFTPSINEFRGNKNLQLKIEGFSISKVREVVAI